MAPSPAPSSSGSSSSLPSSPSSPSSPGTPPLDPDSSDAGCGRHSNAHRLISPEALDSVLLVLPEGGHLSLSSQSLCLGHGGATASAAMRRLGLPPEQVVVSASEDGCGNEYLPFDNASFDFVLSAGGLDGACAPAQVAMEGERGCCRRRAEESPPPRLQGGRGSAADGKPKRMRGGGSRSSQENHPAGSQDTPSGGVPAQGHPLRGGSAARTPPARVFLRRATPSGGVLPPDTPSGGVLCADTPCGGVLCAGHP
ncbi:hypothetical protein Taro_022697 [Colocasia esculenta]|uniref:Uncharacterized protein n=1 Tax=Colocasia esculenta TaxID=4460 RepID=A0A843UV53_COLES|nr:hypothetical protein [Colocasia esculenta]